MSLVPHILMIQGTYITTEFITHITQGESCCIDKIIVQSFNIPLDEQIYVTVFFPNFLK